MKLSDFKDLSDVELGLVKWLQDGKRTFYVVSDSVPDTATEANTIRAPLIRYLALGGCEACRPPETGVLIEGAWIDSHDIRSSSMHGLDLGSATLYGDLGLVGCCIPDALNLVATKLKSLFLTGSTLKGGIEGDRMHAEGGVFLRGATVTGSIRFLGARLGGNLECDGAYLSADADYSKAVAGSALFCDRMQTDGSVFLSGANIVGEVRLLGTLLGGELDCVDARMTADGNALICDGAIINGGLFLLEETKFNGMVRLTAATFGAICDDPKCWPDQIELNRCRYGAFLGSNSPTDAKSRLDWLSRMPAADGVFKPDPYEQCAKVLREMGHGADAQTILIKRDELLRDSAFVRKSKLYGNFGPLVLFLRRALDASWRWSTGYGRAPLRALRPLAVFWLIGTVVFHITAHMGQIKPNLPQTQVHPAWGECASWGTRRWTSHSTQVDCFHAQTEGKSYPYFNAIFYSADTLFPVVSLEMQSYWIPDDTKPFGMLARWYLWVHIIAGWALTLLAVAGFSGLIKTDSK